MATWIQRVIGAARLDPTTYEEVEADKGATGQAMAVVVLSSLAAGIGAIGQHGLGRGPIGMAIAGLVGWFVWAFITWLVGTKILPEPETKADFGELLRTIGFAAAPGILRVFAGLRFIGPLIGFVVAVWMLAAMVVAVRQALDYRTTGRAALVCLLGFAAYVAILVVAALALGMGTWMLGSMVGRTP